MEEIQRHLFEIKEQIIRLGTIGYSRHYENDILSVSYQIKRKRESISLVDSDLKFTMTIILVERFKDEYYRLMIDLYKVSERYQLKGLTENFRGDYQEVILDPDMIENVLQEFQKFLDRTNVERILREKVIENYITSAKKILTTDSVYKENVAKYGKYSNGGAFVSVHSETNQNILDRLYKYPITLDWVDIENIKDYGFNKVIDLIEFISNSDFFKKLEVEISQQYGYEPSIFMRNNKLYFGCSK